MFAEALVTAAAALSLGALGDSISVGWASGDFAAPAPENAWVTIVSRRLQVRRLANQAVPGTTMEGLVDQVPFLPRGLDVVTIEMGLNDACNGPTAARRFGSQFAAALEALAAREPRARVVVLSIFDAPAMWDAVKSVPNARKTRMFCPAATTGRVRFERTLRALNAQLAAVCARYARCVYDGGAAYRIRWRRRDIATVDYFHPSRAGRRTIADAVWKTGLLGTR